MNNKKVKLTLVGLDGNIFALLGSFTRAARRQGWTKDEIETVTKQVTSSPDYDHALNVLMENCEDED